MGKFSKDEYFSIQASVLKKDTLIPFALHIHLPLNDHIIRLVTANTTFDDELEAKFTRKNITEFFVNKNDLKAYEIYIADEDFNEDEFLPDDAGPAPEERLVESIEKPTEEIANNETVTTEISAEPSADEADKLLSEDIFEEEEPVSLLETPAELRMQKYRDMLKNKDKVPIKPEDAQKMLYDILNSENDEAKDTIDDAHDLVSELLEEAEVHDKSLGDLSRARRTGHSSNVSVFAVLMAIGVGISDKEVLQDIAIAALVHDIGLTLVNPLCVWKPLIMHSSKEIAEFNKHIEFGEKLLNLSGFTLNKRVKMLISNHHEKFDGTGYPQGLKGFKLDEVAQLLSFADFLETVSRGFYDGRKRTLKESLTVIHLTEKDPSFPQYFKPELYRKLSAWIKTEETLVDEISAA